VPPGINHWAVATVDGAGKLPGKRIAEYAVKLKK
jgi:hypothetical protein